MVSIKYLLIMLLTTQLFENAASTLTVKPTPDKAETTALNTETRKLVVSGSVEVPDEFETKYAQYVEIINGNYKICRINKGQSSIAEDAVINGVSAGCSDGKWIWNSKEDQTFSVTFKALTEFSMDYFKARFSKNVGGYEDFAFGVTYTIYSLSVSIEGAPAQPLKPGEAFTTVSGFRTVQICSKLSESRNYQYTVKVVFQSEGTSHSNDFKDNYEKQCTKDEVYVPDSSQDSSLKVDVGFQNNHPSHKASDHLTFTIVGESLPRSNGSSATLPPPPPEEKDVLTIFIMVAGSLGITSLMVAVLYWRCSRDKNEFSLLAPEIAMTDPYTPYRQSMMTSSMGTPMGSMMGPPMGSMMGAPMMGPPMMGPPMMGPPSMDPSMMRGSMMSSRGFY